jgi:hypothetical protein
MSPKHKSSNAKEASGHKTWKERLTLVLCNNTTEHIGKKECM